MFRVIGGIAVTAVALVALAACEDDAPTQTGTGGMGWRYPTGTPVSSSPAVADGVVYVGSYASLYAVDAESGELRWGYTTGGRVHFSPAVVGGVVYVG